MNGARLLAPATNSKPIHLQSFKAPNPCWGKAESTCCAPTAEPEAISRHLESKEQAMCNRPQAPFLLASCLVSYLLVWSHGPNRAGGAGQHCLKRLHPLLLPQDNQIERLRTSHLHINTPSETTPRSTVGTRVPKRENYRAAQKLHSAAFQSTTQRRTVQTQKASMICVRASNTVQQSANLTHRGIALRLIA